MKIAKQTDTPVPTESRRRVLDKRRQALLHVPPDIELDGSTAFRHTRHVYVPKKGGVYLIHDLRGVLYVGRTCNLYRRFDEHYWFTDNELLSLAMRQSFGEFTFSWILADSEQDRINLECRLVVWLRPACNRLLPGTRN